MNKIVSRAPLDRAGRFLVGGFALLACVIALTILLTRTERATDRSAQSSLLTDDRLVDLLSTMRQAESGLRGYLLTGNSVSLNTYDLAVATVPADLQRLDEVLGDGADQTSLVAVHHLVSKKLAELAAVMTAETSGQHAAAVALVNTNLNLHTMQDLRDLIGTLKTAQFVQFHRLEMANAWAEYLLQISTIAAVLGTGLLAWFAIRDNRIQTSQLRQAEAALFAANEVLERKVEERTRAIRKSEMVFRTLAEWIPGFLYQIDLAGAKMYANPQFSAFTGLSDAQVSRDGWMQALHPEDAARSRALWQRCIGEGAPIEMEYRFRRHDGVYRWFLARAAPILDEGNAITGWIGTCTDIDDRKRAEAELAAYSETLELRVAERTRELERIFELSTDILTVSTFEGTVLSASPAWSRILGRPMDDIIGRDITAFIHPEDLATAQAKLLNITAGQPAGFACRLSRADGSWCWLSWRGVPLPGERLIYAVARDITDERERDEKLRQSQKMEVVGQLTGGVAHDFNNLLTIIMGSLELLQRSLEHAEPRILRRVDAAMDGARRAAALTHRLLAFSRRQPLAPRPIEVNRLLASMSDMLHRTLGEAVAVEIVAGAGLWPALADANQLENALLNLAINARDAMPNGGHLTIETQNTYLGDDYVAGREDVPAGQYVEIAVADTGAGMPAEVRDKVFEPFFTTKPQGQGTGLGLAQVYGFIKQSGGHVAIYSEAGHGTTVKLFLPRLRAAADQLAALPGPAERGPAEIQAADAAREAPQIQGRGQTILLVEDEEGVRNFATEVLQELGYHVLVADSAAQALQRFAAAPHVDILFTDVVLSGPINGRKLADEILSRAPGVIVLFTTGYTRNAIIHHGRLDEGINFLGKPFTANALGRAIHKLLESAKVSQS